MAVDSTFIAEARDRKVGDVLGKELKDLRDRIGHALSDTTGAIELVADGLLHVSRAIDDCL